MGLLSTHVASAEVTIAKGETWDAYVAGRASAFFSYANGDAYPVPKQMGSTIQPGGGVDASDPARDAILEYDDMGVALPKQGKLNKMRVRSGYYPNILTVGVHKRWDRLKLTGQISLWGTIESDDTKAAGKAEYAPANGIRDNGVSADFREGFLRLESDWGQLDGGRFMSIVGRGLTEMDALYGHGYGAGFPTVQRNGLDAVTGDLTFPGPMGGMTGFGILSASYSPGLMYTTPSLGGLKVALGIFDATRLPSNGWNATRQVRPEAEIFYDMRSDGFLLHVFGSAGFQKMYQSGAKYSSSIWASTFGARLEAGPVRIGAGGFYGKGAGVDYAFDVNPANTSPATMRAVVTTNPDGSTNTSMEKTNEFRNQRGFVGIAQVVLGKVDISAGAGQTQILLLQADRDAATTISSLKTQTAFFAGVVYHVNESFHFDLDYINGGYRWYGGESQKLNVINLGTTITF